MICSCKKLKRGNTLKRLIMMILALLLLTACGREVHENIEEGLVEDTEQIIAIFDENIKEDEALSKKEEKTFQEYIVKYEVMKENPEVYGKESFTDEENRLFVMTQKMIEEYEFYTSSLSSDEENYENERRRIYNVIETGQIYD